MFICFNISNASAVDFFYLLFVVLYLELSRAEKLARQKLELLANHCKGKKIYKENRWGKKTSCIEYSDKILQQYFINAKVICLELKATPKVMSGIIFTTKIITNNECNTRKVIGHCPLIKHALTILIIH